jgi:very-short-patch-repair endonuclease
MGSIKTHGNAGRTPVNKKHIDKDLLFELYVIQQKSLLEISKLVGISNVALKTKLMEYNIPQRSHSENQSIASKTKGTKSFDYGFDWYNEQYNKLSTDEIADKLGCSPSLIQQRLKYYGIDTSQKISSKPERIIFDILDNLNITYLKRDRTTLNGSELDIFIPKFNLAIEVNGLYWHSSVNGKTIDYHLTKTEKCSQLGIELLQFWDYEVIKNKDKIESILHSKLGLNKRIYARKCKLVKISNMEAKSFFDTYHMQGHIPASSYIGLLYNNELISLASFSKPRFNKSYDLELIRFVTKSGITVVGGLSKILASIKLQSIISYANRRWSMGNVYTACGFKLLSVSRPAVWYTKDFKLLENRLKFQKHKLKSLDAYSDIKTAEQILSESGYYKIWDCGNLVYVKERTTN